MVKTPKVGGRAMGRRPVGAWATIIPVPENKLALQAGKRLARALAKPGSSPRSPFGILVLHGPSGVGKSAIAAAVMTSATQRSSKNLPAIDLARAGADALALKLVELDALTIEDLHRLPKRAAARVANLLDARVARKLPTIVTSIDGPARLTTLPRRLTNRLAAGLVVRMEVPKPTSRQKIVGQVAKAKGVELTIDAIAWLAATEGVGLREALGRVEALAPLAKKRRRALDAAAVKKHFGDTPAVPADPLPRVLEVVSKTYRIKPKDLCGKSRLKTVLLPRQVAMYIARTHFKVPLKSIGLFFGKRDHTTVMSSCEKVTEMLKTDAALKKAIRELSRALS